MSHITTCPHCSARLSVSEQITDKTLICPRCLADVDNVRSMSQIQAPQLNTDVKRDLSAGSIVLAALIGLCLLGIVLVIGVPLQHPGEEGIPRLILLMFLFAALDILVSIVFVRGLIRWGISGVRGPSVGRVFGIMFLSLGTIVAICIFLFFTCGLLATLRGF